jgi:hypothetical protein
MIYGIAQVIKDWLVDHNVRKLSVHELAVQRKNLAKGIDPSQNVKSDEETDEEMYNSREYHLIVDTEEEAERKANSGTTFSIDLFLKWKSNFDRERKEREEKELKEILEDPEKVNRITGKKYFEKRAAMHFGGQVEDELKSSATEKKGLLVCTISIFF